jgi:hypothetical protein
MRRKWTVNKSWRRGWKGDPIKPLSAAAKRRRTEWLAGWNLRMSQLLFAEAERR